jgi:GMP synthase (glutamine-hydrolysing)
MIEPRLKTEIWVKAHIRKAAAAGVPAMVVRHGDDDAGAVLIKVNTLTPDGCMVFAASRDLDGRRIWRRATGNDPVAEADADGYIARQVGYDSDLWIIEIEDREGRHFLDEPTE